MAAQLYAFSFCRFPSWKLVENVSWKSFITKGSCVEIIGSFNFGLNCRVVAVVVAAVALAVALPAARLLAARWRELMTIELELGSPISRKYIWSFRSNRLKKLTVCWIGWIGLFIRTCLAPEPGWETITRLAVFGPIFRTRLFCPVECIRNNWPFWLITGPPV